MRTLLGILLGVLLLGTCALAADYNYIKADALKSRLNNDPEMTIVDICPPERFAKGHIPSSIETNAYPVKNADDRSRLAALLTKLGNSDKDIVIVCPRGGGGAKRSYDFYASREIATKRLLILENGMEGYPHETVAK